MADLNGTPWWIKSPYVQGPVAFGFVIFLAVFVGWLPSPLADIQRTLSIHVEYDKQNHRLLKAICRNTAKSEMSMRECNE